MFRKHPPLAAKILLNAAVVITGFCALVAWMAADMRTELRAREVATLQHLVDVAHSQLVEYEHRVQSGELTVAEAQARARERLRNLRYDDDEYFWINDLTPAMVMHPFKPQMEGQALGAFADPDGKLLFAEMVAVCQARGEGAVGYRWPKPGQDKPVGKTSYVKLFAPWGWIVGTGAYNDETDAALARVTWTVVIVAALVTLGAGLLMIRTAASITRPIRQGVDFARSLADGDLTQQLDLKRGDEVGVLAASLNEMSGNLQLLIGDVADGVRTLSTSSEELLEVSRNIATSSKDTSGRVDNVAAATEQMSGSMSSVAAAMDQAAGAVQSVAGATEEMTATINDIARRSARARTVAETAVAESARATARVNDLGEAARAIDEITGVISAISSQTNLLALNATIEAAHAGDVGRGFAVVAGEIKTLAHRTEQATADIRSRIEAIQQATAAGVEDIRCIGATVEEISGIVTAIAASIEEQAATSQAMAGDIAQVASGLGDVNRNIARSSQAAGVIAEDVIGVSAVSAEVLEESARIRESAQALAEFAAGLQDKVARFKVV